MVEKVLFWGHIFEIEILMDLHVIGNPELKYHILSFWSVTVCVSVISITQKHQIWYFKFVSYTDAN